MGTPLPLLILGSCHNRHAGLCCDPAGIGPNKIFNSHAAAQSHGYVRAAMANNAVKGPARAITDWTDRKMPVLDYSI